MDASLGESKLILVLGRRGLELICSNDRFQPEVDSD